MTFILEFGSGATTKQQRQRHSLQRQPWQRQPGQRQYWLGQPQQKLSEQRQPQLSWPPKIIFFCTLQTI